MKVCSNCFRSNEDNAERCRECGKNKFEPLNSLAPVNNQTESDEGISPRYRSILWWGGWGAVTVFFAVTNPPSLAAFYAFPLGLMAWLPGGTANAIMAFMFGGWMIGWSIYLLIAVALSNIKKRGLFFLIYGVFCVLLILNVVGCQRVMEAASGIH